MLNMNRSIIVKCEMQIAASYGGEYTIIQS